MKVLALDPGEKIGWARVKVGDNGAWQMSDFKHGISPLRDMAVALTKSFADYDVVICETWRLSAGKARTFIGSSFPAVQFIGMVRLLGWLNPKVKVVWQDPSTKTTAEKTMHRLRPELYELVTQRGTHDDLHDMDAIRHLWHWTFCDLIKEIPV